MKKMKIDYLHAANRDALGVRRTASGRALADAIALTAEVCGQVLSPAAAELLADDLGDFDEAAVLAALARCRREMQGPLKLSDILARIDDGRPDAGAAWDMIPKSELASVVWTEEMAHAWGIALPLLNAGDADGARRTFCEAYANAVLGARGRRQPVRWQPSLGSDVGAREPVLLDALRKGRLSAAHVEQLLPCSAGALLEAEIAAQVKIKKLH